MKPVSIPSRGDRRSTSSSLTTRRGQRPWESCARVLQSGRRQPRVPRTDTDRTCLGRSTAIDIPDAEGTRPTAVITLEESLIMPSTTRLHPRTACATTCASWAELRTSDPAAAKSFYSSLFGWAYYDQPMPDGPHFSVAMTDGRPIAVIAPAITAQQQPAAWISHRGAGDVDHGPLAHITGSTTIRPRAATGTQPIVADEAADAADAMLVATPAEFPRSAGASRPRFLLDVPHRRRTAGGDRDRCWLRNPRPVRSSPSRSSIRMRPSSASERWAAGH